MAFPYFERVPDQSIVLDNGKQYNRLSATRGKDYLLVYNYTGRTMKLDLRKISGSKKNLWTYNTQNGMLTYIGEYDNKVVSLDISPANGSTDTDFVLIAVDADKTYLAKDQKKISDQNLSGKTRDLNE